MSTFIPVILAGGAGTRLWPVSREALPKPFIKLPDGQTLLEKALCRAASLPTAHAILTVTNRDYYFLVRDEYESASPPLSLPQSYLLEPMGRNTAPAIIAAALHVAATYGPDSTLLILAADHIIQDTTAFAAATAEAIKLAEHGFLVTLGIAPRHPETGFGYIQCGEKLTEAEHGNKVLSFVEKPDLDTAERYIASGQYLWNSGMFVFQAQILLDAAALHAPTLLQTVAASVAAGTLDGSTAYIDKDAYAQAQDISIDFAIMEKAANIAVVPCEFDWNDLGSWDAIAQFTPRDKNGNRINGNAVAIDASGCYVQSADRLVALVGTQNIYVVDTPDALLLADRERLQDVKQVVQQLKLSAHDSVRHHRTVRRPWGTYTVLEQGERFKIKRIVVKPGASLSLQLHHHRSEHWVVVSGAAKVSNGDREIMVHSNESTYIPAGTLHRLMNPGIIDCVMIEVQAGDYVGEDDIVRFEDNYGRA